MKYISLDFEYRSTNQAKLELVCGALEVGDVEGNPGKETITASEPKIFWLHKNKNTQEILKEYLLMIRDTHVLLAFNVDAEGRSLISLGLDPTKFMWVDIQAEWKMLTNHNDSLGYGTQLINGEPVKLYKSTYGGKTPLSLLACTSKLLRPVSSQEYTEKNKMRDLILGTTQFNDIEKGEISNYCVGDIQDLAPLYLAQLKHYYRLLNKTQFRQLHKEQLWRGETVARAALISSIGYPVSRPKVVNFTQNIPKILKECQEDINSQWPDHPLFRWNEPEKRYSLDTKIVKEWVEKSEWEQKWMKTPTKEYSISLDAFGKHFDYRHTFPRNNFPAQFQRYLKLNQSLNGFRPKSLKSKNRQTFFSYYGDDNRAHPYLNAYGAQSGRYQPKATGFIHLKAAWMRSLVEPVRGRAIAAIDYASEEFLIAALLSKDTNMIKAYESGDVYLYFAKLAGAIPWSGTKAKYKSVRDKFKSTTLGISYQMGASALANKLTVDTGVRHTLDDALDLIDQFADSYPEYVGWVEENELMYRTHRKIKLPCGWYMFGDNLNGRSVGNMPIQGMGSSILRKAIQLAQDAGLTVILPLHDALYIEYDSHDMRAVSTLEKCMREAFSFYFRKDKEKANRLIQMDINVWSPDYTNEGTTYLCGNLTGQMQKYYVDGRSETEYKKFSKYF